MTLFPAPGFLVPARPCEKISCSIADQARKCIHQLVEGAHPPTGEGKMQQVIDDSTEAIMVSLRTGISTSKKGVQTFMNLKNAISGLLAALIAIPMYYMFFSMFRHGFETNTFIVALILGVIAFLVTWFIASLIARSKQRAA